MIHQQHAPVQYNLLDNGAFTHYSGRQAVVTNDGAASSVPVVDVVDLSHYGRVNHSVVLGSVDSPVASWTTTGDGSVTIAPQDESGNQITSIDGGNVLKVTFSSDNTIVMSQELTDIKRLHGQVISVSLTGSTMVGRPTITASLRVDGQDSIVAVASAATFGSHRRIGGFAQVSDEAEQVEVVIEIDGCSGESVGLSGIMAAIGVAAGTLPFTSSLRDRVIPAGVVLLSAGSVCPPGYVEVAKEQAAIVSGVAAVQVDKGVPVRQVGSNYHDHTGGVRATLGDASDEAVETPIPLGATNTSLIRGVTFGDYPSNVPYAPYPGELPVDVLGPAHSHTVNTKMEALPPSFNLKFCQKQ